MSEGDVAIGIDYFVVVKDVVCRDEGALELLEPC